MMNSIFTLQELKENYKSVLRLLAQIQEDHTHMQQALEYLKQLPNQHVPGDIANQAKAIAASDIVKSREKTNQELIAVYQKMYEDLRSVMFQQELPDESHTESGDK